MPVSSTTSSPKRRPWRIPGPPDNEVGRGVPIDDVLGRGPDAALFLLGAQAYSTGVLFQVGLRLRRRFDEYSSNINMAMMGAPVRGPDSDVQGRLLMGVQFSDGRRAVMITGLDPSLRTDKPAEPGAVSMLCLPGGSSGGLSYDSRYWLTPLPTSGALLWVTRWPSLGVEETTVELDGTALSDGGAASTVLWPPVPAEARDLPPPPPPPTDGWFAGTGKTSI